VAKNQTETQQ